MKTFIKWQGNKSQHINKFIQYIPEFTGTYIEPFVGSGAMLLKLQPEKWIINDKNKDLINVWKDVKNSPEEIIDYFQEFGKEFKKLSKQEKINMCKKITKTIEEKQYNIERSSTFMLMKFCVYMGNIFINNKYQFLGLDLNITIQNRYFFLEDNYYNNLIDVSYFMNETKGKIYNKDYISILEKAKKGDFVFLDPPYIEDHDYQFNYNKNEILDNLFLKKLLVQIKKLNNKGVKWLMTQADTDEIKSLFKNYTIKTMKVYRTGSKSYVNELIIFNY